MARWARSAAPGGGGRNFPRAAAAGLAPPVGGYTASMSKPDNAIDYARTAQQRAGMVMRDGREVPGAAFLIVSVVSIVGFMTALAMHNAGWMIGLGAVVLVAATTGVSWILLGRHHADHLGTTHGQP